MRIQDQLTIYIFSFNRGRFLSNAIDSCLRYAPGVPVLVIDDNSDDPDTLAVLNNLPEGVSWVKPQARGDDRHGGLYNNMQQALDSVTSEWILFIQDDMQLVRPLEQDDAQYIADFFQQFPEKGFLNPVFLKGQRHKRDNRITRVFEDFHGYYRHYPEKKNPRGISYADVVIGHAGRLKAKGWQFSASEQTNASQANELFGGMGFMAHPFVMFLPQVPVYRGKKKTAAVALAEKWSGMEPKRFVEQSAEHWAGFKRRPLTELPVAETYLQCVDPKVKTPYQYSAVNAYWPLRAWHKLALLLNK